MLHLHTSLVKEVEKARFSRFLLLVSYLNELLSIKHQLRVELDSNCNYRMYNPLSQSFCVNHWPKVVLAR